MTFCSLPLLFWNTHSHTLQSSKMAKSSFFLPLINCTEWVHSSACSVCSVFQIKDSSREGRNGRQFWMGDAEQCWPISALNDAISVNSMHHHINVTQWRGQSSSIHCSKFRLMGTARHFFPKETMQCQTLYFNWLDTSNLVCCDQSNWLVAFRCPSVFWWNAAML